jgi:hypothetical protein
MTDRDKADADQDRGLDPLGDEDDEVTAVGGSIATEFFRLALARLAGDNRGPSLSDGETWLLSLAVAGVLENCAFEQLCELAAEVGRRRCDPALELALLIDAASYETARARHNQGASPRPALEEGFRTRLRNLYLRTVKRSRQS